jgi:transposase
VSRGDLTDEEWAVFEPFVTRKGRRGRPTPHHRRSLNGILWIARTGAQWRDVPERYGEWDAVYKQFERWTKGGLWETLLEALAESDPGASALQMIDATIVRAHHRAAGGKGGFTPKGSGDRAAASHRKSMPVSTRKAARSTS